MPIKPISFLKDNKQIIYAVLLLIVVPSAVVLNTWLFSVLFRQTIDQSLTNKAIAVSAAVNAAVVDKLDDQEALQAYSAAFALQSSDVRDLQVYWPHEQGFELVASWGEQDLGAIKNYTSYVVAWNKNSPSAQAVLEPSGQQGKFNRYWIVVTPLKDAEGNKQALLVLKVGADIIDTITASALSRSYWLLLATVLVIVLLLFANSRLFEYAILYRKIKEVDAMKDEFVSMASHELKTPITVIQGYIDLILTDKSGQLTVSPKAKECLSMVDSSTNRLRLLIEDLLNVSRIDQGRIKMELKPLVPWTIIQEVVKELKLSAEQKQLQLEAVCEVDEQVLVKLDANHFKQVLINVIGNAIKYTAKGSVKVSMESKDQKVLTIIVKDTGIGMATKDRERLFEKFYRIRNEETAAISGTGLGLWISKQLVELMAGTLAVDSIEKVGTQFTLEFPISKA